MLSSQKRLVSIIISLVMIVCMAMPFASAQSNPLSSSFDDIINCYDLISVHRISDYCYVASGYVIFGDKEAVISHDIDRNQNSDSSEPAIILISFDEDGTINMESTVFVSENEQGRLTSVFTINEIDEIIETEKYTLASTRSTSGTSTYVNGIMGDTTYYTITLRATYASISMASYGLAGYCVAPNYSYFTYTKNGGSYSIGATSMATQLTGLNTRYVSDPSQTVSGLDFPVYLREYTSTGPVSGYTYTFNDYNYYTSTTYTYGGYSGYYIYISGGFGSYFLETEFVYNGTSYINRLGIYNSSNQSA